MSNDHRQPVSSGKALASLLLGIFSFCVPVILGLPAIILGIMGLSSISQSRGAVTGKGMAIAGIILGVISTVVVPILALILLLMGGIQGAREAATRAQSTNNLRQIGLAMQTYHDTRGHLPGGPRGDLGSNPNLSWRVTILPYVEEAKLYSEFLLDEPWDSPHNIKLLPRMPKVYLCPRYQSPTDASSGLTYYRGFTGPGAVLGSPAPLNFTAITNNDGTGTTWLVVEAGDPVPWTKPDDLVYDPNGPLPAFGGPNRGDFYALFADGHVQRLSAKTDEKILRAYITWNGNEVIPPDQR